MDKRHVSSMVAVAVAVAAVATLWITRTAGQSTASTAPGASRPPARLAGKPNLSGIWQAINEANWDLEAHAARPGAVTQPGVYPYRVHARPGGAGRRARRGCGRARLARRRAG